MRDSCAPPPAGGERQRQQEHAHPAVPRRDGPHDPGTVWSPDVREAEEHREPRQDLLQNLPRAPPQLLSTGVGVGGWVGGGVCVHSVSNAINNEINMMAVELLTVVR